jgi:hypothetical protein
VLCCVKFLTFVRFTLLPCLLAGAARGFSTFQSRINPAGTKAFGLPTKVVLPRREYHYAAQIARRGSPRQRVVGAASVIAMSALFFTTCLMRANAAPWIHASDRCISANDATIMLPAPVFNLRGGDRGGHDEYFDPPLTPPIEFAHGTTTISFVFNGGIVAAVDSRASIGNFVGSKTVQKVLPVSR